MNVFTEAGVGRAVDETKNNSDTVILGREGGRGGGREGEYPRVPEEIAIGASSAEKEEMG